MKFTIFPVVFLLIFCASSFATDITINGSKFTINDKAKNSIQLDNNWRFRIGDNTEWAEPGFDYSRWDTAFLPLSIESLLPFQYKGIVWLRSTFNVSQKEVSRSLSLMVEQFGASEIYIDGKLFRKFGVVGRSATSEEHYNPLLIPESFIMDSLGKHTIAVRYSNHKISGRNKLAAQLNAFDLHIGLTNDALFVYQFKKVKESILTSIGIGGFLSLCVMNFILFLFYKREKGNLFYSLFSGAVAITFILQSIKYKSGSAATVVLMNQLNVCFVLLSNFFLVALVYSFIYEKNRNASG